MFRRRSTGVFELRGEGMDAALGVQVAFIGLASKLLHLFANIDVQGVHVISLQESVGMVVYVAGSYLVKKELCRAVANAAIGSSTHNCRHLQLYSSRPLTLRRKSGVPYGGLGYSGVSC